MKKRILKLLYLIIFLLPAFLSARENATGIWIGTLTGPHPNLETTEVYVSIHETEDLSVVIFLSAVEESGDLLSSTYIGSGIGTTDYTLESFGEHAYFPVGYDPENNKIAYGPYSSIWIRIREDGTAEGLVASGIFAFQHPIQLRKIVGTQ